MNLFGGGVGNCEMVLSNACFLLVESLNFHSCSLSSVVSYRDNFSMLFEVKLVPLTTIVDTVRLSSSLCSHNFDFSNTLTALPSGRTRPCRRILQIGLFVISRNPSGTWS